jgi:hypothetical protein
VDIVYMPYMLCVYVAAKYMDVFVGRENSHRSSAHEERDEKGVISSKPPSYCLSVEAWRKAAHHSLLSVMIMPAHCALWYSKGHACPSVDITPQAPCLVLDGFWSCNNDPS